MWALLKTDERIELACVPVEMLWYGQIRGRSTFSFSPVDLVKLQLLLTAKHLQPSGTEAISTLAKSVMTLLSQEEWDESFAPRNVCPVCQKESRLNESGLFACERSHAFPRCINTLAPVVDTNYMVCRRGCGVVNRQMETESPLCCCCDSVLEENYL